MNQKSPESNDLIFEVSVRLQLKDYKTKLGLKKAWAIALLIALIRLGFKFWLSHS